MKTFYYFLFCSMCALNAFTQTTCSLDWENNITPPWGSLNNTFIASSANIIGHWKTSNPLFGSFASGRPNFGSFANTLLTSARGGGFGAKTTITFASPVDFYRLHIKDLRADGINNEAQKIEAYLNNVAVNRIYSTSNASLVTINASTNTINGSSLNTDLSQGEVMIAFAGPVDSLIVKSSGTSDYIFIDLICPDGLQSVAMSSLNATTQNDGVQLTWNTYKEYNNAGFQVQQSNDGMHFENIGFIQGKMNSNTLNQYSFKDVEYRDNKNFYRLLQLNTDNSYTLSNTVKANVGKSANIFYYYENKLFVNVTFENKTWMKIYNPTGGIVFQKEISKESFILDTNQFPSGIYVAVLQSATHSYIFKFTNQ